MPSSRNNLVSLILNACNSSMLAKAIFIAIEKKGYWTEAFFFYVHDLLLFVTQACQG
jgi:hypothetical protein